MIFDDESQLMSYYRNLELPLCSCIIYRMDSNGVMVDSGGVSLERQVPGFRTESVEGRDSLDTDITELEYPHLDGAKYQSKRALSRDITINYKLVSTTPEIHRKKLAKLRAILFGSELEYSMFRFRDEVNVCENGGVYYVGTVKSMTEAQFVRNFASEGTIEIHCSDPFKYSCHVFSQKATKNSAGKYTFAIEYNGSYPSSPKFIARQPKGTENGYIAFFDEKSHVVQAGDPKEVDGSYIAKDAETLVNVDFGVDDIYSNGKGWWGNIFTAPTNTGGKPIYANGEVYTYKTAFTREANSKMPDGTGVWLKKTDSTTADKWHGPSLYKAFVPKSPVENVHLDFDYVFAKQSNGKENLMSGYEIILFGVDVEKPGDPYSYNKCWDNKKISGRSVKYRTHPRINGQDYVSFPMVRVAIWAKSPTNSKAGIWIQANNTHKQSIDFDCRMPLKLVDNSQRNKKEGWVEWTTGQWAYKKNGKWLKGWQQLKDSRGVFWFYLDAHGYCLTKTYGTNNGWADLKWSKGTNRFYFNANGEMATGTQTIDGKTYAFDKNGCLQTGTPTKVGWKGSGYMWRYYKKDSKNKFYYVTGWNKVDGKWYYMDASGYTVHGWQKLKWNHGKNTDTFYFNSSCAMVTGTQKINGVTYQFDGNGCLKSGQAVALTSSANTTKANGQSSKTDVYYKLETSKLSIEVFNRKLSVTVNKKTYTFNNAVPERTIFTGVGLQHYVYKNYGDFTYTQAKIDAGTPIGVQYADKLVVKSLKSEWKDATNTFTGGSVATIDCNTGDIYLNDAKKPGLGALGNDYETLKIIPKDSVQEIQCDYSKWVKDGSEPEFTIEYREVYI